MAEEKNFRHLVRIANTDLDGNKPFYCALTKIKGVGYNFANAIVKVSKADSNKKIGSLSDQELKTLNEIIESPQKFNIPAWLYNRKKDPETGEDKHLLTSDLNFVQENDIKTMKKIKCYKGVRHYSNLPARGQRTKSNFRRNKGKVTGVKRKKGKSGKV